MLLFYFGMGEIPLTATTTTTVLHFLRWIEVSDGEWVGYDDVETVCAKLQFAQRLGMHYVDDSEILQTHPQLPKFQQLFFGTHDLSSDQLVICCI